MWNPERPDPKRRTAKPFRNPKPQGLPKLSVGPKEKKAIISAHLNELFILWLCVPQTSPTTWESRMGPGKGLGKDPGKLKL